MGTGDYEFPCGLFELVIVTLHHTYAGEEWHSHINTVEPQLMGVSSACAGTPLRMCVDDASYSHNTVLDGQAIFVVSVIRIQSLQHLARVDVVDVEFFGLVKMSI